MNATRTATERVYIGEEWEGDYCTCFFACGEDSYSGDWHQHSDDPCPIHPSAPMA